jgi:hypothetical protein
MYFIACVYKWYMAVVQHHIDNFTSNDAFTINFFDILYLEEKMEFHLNWLVKLKK